MQECDDTKNGLALRFGWTNVLMLSSVFGVVLLCELIGFLDMVPIILLFPSQVIFGALAILTATLVFIFVGLRWRGWKLQFSTRSLLVLGFMVAWSVSRFTVDATVERTRIRSQQDCFEMARNLKPGPGQILMSGRYNDGHHDFAIQRWLLGLVALSINTNEIRFEIGNISSMDLSGTNIVDDQLGIVARTRSVSELNLSSTNVTDAGLDHLYELRSLKLLRLANTSVSMTAIEKLKSKIPGILVEQ